MCRTEAAFGQRLGRNGSHRTIRRRASAFDEPIATKGATEKFECGSSDVSTAAGDSLSSSSNSPSSIEISAECKEVQQFEETPLRQGGTQEIVAALSAVYKAILAVKQKPGSVTSFHAVRAPSTPVDAYLARLRKYFDCSDACLITSLVYIDRIVKLYPAFAVGKYTIHRLLAVSMVLAAKYNDDVYYSNKYYGKVCGMSLKEVNALECEFIKLLNWKLGVSSEEYYEYLDRVLPAARKLGQQTTPRANSPAKRPHPDTISADPAAQRPTKRLKTKTAFDHIQIS